jgi:hypothetical protein
MASIQRNVGKKYGAKLVNTEKKILRCLEHMRTSYEHVSQGHFPETLGDIERKQNTGGGLTHVTDNVFLFYEALESERRKLHSLDRLAEVGESLFEDTIEKLRYQDSIHESFMEIFKDMHECDGSVINDLKFKMIDSYIVVANNEFRKFAAQCLGKRKVFAHRHEIFRGSKKQKQEENKEEQPKAQPKTAPESSQEPQAATKIVEETSQSSVGMDIVQVDSAASTAIPSNDHPEIANSVKGKGKGKSSTTIAQSTTQSTSVKTANVAECLEKQYSCPKCKLPFPDRKQWIGCDGEGCDDWYHRTCIGINKTDWDKFKTTDAKWLCDRCK